MIFTSPWTYFLVFVAIQIQCSQPILGSPLQHDASLSTQMSVACSRYVNACHQVASDQSSETIKYVCKKGKGRKSTKFTFGCSAGSIDLTRTALRALAKSAYPDVSDTSTVTQTITAGAAPEQTSTSTIFFTTTNLQDVTLATTVTSVVTSLAASTSLVAPVQRRASDDNVDDSQFCQAYANSCSRQCSKNPTIIAQITCQAGESTGGSLTYTLACKCPQSLTQHALAVIGLAGKSSSATTVTTQLAAPATTKVLQETSLVTTTKTITASISTQTTATTTTSTVLSTATPSSFIVQTSDNRYLYTASYTNPRAASSFGGILLTSSLSQATRYYFDRSTGHVCEVDQDFPQCWSGNNVYGPHAASFMSQTDEYAQTSPYAFHYMNCSKPPSTLTGTITCTLAGTALGTIYVETPQNEYPCIGDSTSSGCASYLSYGVNPVTAITLTYQYVV